MVNNTAEGVSIILVNFNTPDLTHHCIKSIFEFTKIPFEIIVIDNHSTTHDPHQFKIDFPQISLIVNEQNLGFAKANNIGIKLSKFQHILLLNSDTFLKNDAIDSAYSKYISLENEGIKLGAMSIRLIYPDGRFQHTARNFRTSTKEILDLLRPLLYLVGYQKRSRLMMNQYFNGDYSTFCDMVSGAFFLFNRNLLTLLPNQILDERYFMYGEDVLWSWQLKQLGFQNYFFHESEIIHINQGSRKTKKKSPLKLTMIMKHELDFYKLRFGAGFGFQIFKFIYLGKEFGRNILLSLLKNLNFIK